MSENKLKKYKKKNFIQQANNFLCLNITGR